MVVRLFVGGLPQDISATDVGSRFSPFGKVESIELIPEKRQNPEASIANDKPLRSTQPINRGFAYVELSPKDDVAVHKCLSLYNNSKWRGHLLRVELAKPSYLARLHVDWLSEASPATTQPQPLHPPQQPLPLNTATSPLISTPQLPTLNTVIQPINPALARTAANVSAASLAAALAASEAAAAKRAKAAARSASRPAPAPPPAPADVTQTLEIPNPRNRFRPIKVKLDQPANPPRRSFPVVHPLPLHRLEWRRDDVPSGSESQSDDSEDDGDEDDSSEGLDGAAGPSGLDDGATAMEVDVKKDEKDSGGGDDEDDDEGLTLNLAEESGRQHKSKNVGQRQGTDSAKRSGVDTFIKMVVTEKEERAAGRSAKQPRSLGGTGSSSAGDGSGGSGANNGPAAPISVLYHLNRIWAAPSRPARTQSTPLPTANETTAASAAPAASRRTLAGGGGVAVPPPACLQEIAVQSYEHEQDIDEEHDEADEALPAGPLGGPLPGPTARPAVVGKSKTTAAAGAKAAPKVPTTAIPAATVAPAKAAPTAAAAPVVPLVPKRQVQGELLSMFKVLKSIDYDSRKRSAQEAAAARAAEVEAEAAAAARSKGAKSAGRDAKGGMAGRPTGGPVGGGGVAGAAAGGFLTAGGAGRGAWEEDGGVSFGVVDFMDNDDEGQGVGGGRALPDADLIARFGDSSDEEGEAAGGRYGRQGGGRRQGGRAGAAPAAVAVAAAVEDKSAEEDGGEEEEARGYEERQEVEELRVKGKGQNPHQKQQNLKSPLQQPQQQRQQQQEQQVGAPAAGAVRPTSAAGTKTTRKTPEAKSAPSGAPTPKATTAAKPTAAATPPGTRAAAAAAGPSTGPVAGGRGDKRDRGHDGSSDGGEEGDGPDTHRAGPAAKKPRLQMQQQPLEKQPPPLKHQLQEYQPPHQHSPKQQQQQQPEKQLPKQQQQPRGVMTDPPRGTRVDVTGGGDGDGARSRPGDALVVPLRSVLRSKSATGSGGARKLDEQMFLARFGDDSDDEMEIFRDVDSEDGGEEDKAFRIRGPLVGRWKAAEVQRTVSRGSASGGGGGSTPGVVSFLDDEPNDGGDKVGKSARKSQPQGGRMPGWGTRDVGTPKGGSVFKEGKARSRNATEGHVSSPVEGGSGRLAAAVKGSKRESGTPAGVSGDGVVVGGSGVGSGKREGVMSGQRRRVSEGPGGAAVAQRRSSGGGVVSGDRSLAASFVRPTADSAALAAAWQQTHGAGLMAAARGTARSVQRATQGRAARGGRRSVN